MNKVKYPFVLAVFNTGETIATLHEQGLTLVDAHRVSELHALVEDVNARGGIPGSVRVNGVLVRSFKLTNFFLKVEKGSLVKDFNRCELEAVLEESAEGDSVESIIAGVSIKDVTKELLGDRAIRKNGAFSIRFSYRRLDGLDINITKQTVRRVAEVHVKKVPDPKVVSESVRLANMTRLRNAAIKLQHDWSKNPSDSELLERLNSTIATIVKQSDVAALKSRFNEWVKTLERISVSYTYRDIRFVMQLEALGPYDNSSYAPVDSSVVRHPRMGSVCLSTDSYIHSNVVEWWVTVKSIDCAKSQHRRSPMSALTKRRALTELITKLEHETNVAFGRVAARFIDYRFSIISNLYTFKELDAMVNLASSHERIKTAAGGMC